MVGIEIEFHPTKREEQILEERFRYYYQVKDKMPKSQWVIDYIEEKHTGGSDFGKKRQAELHYLIDCRNPVAFKKSINKLFKDLEGLSIEGSLHFNVVELSVVRYSVAFRYGTHHDNVQRVDSSNHRYAKRYENKYGIFRNGACGKEDLIRQLMLNSYLYRNLKHNSSCVHRDVVNNKLTLSTRDPRERCADPYLIYYYEELISNNYYFKQSIRDYDNGAEILSRLQSFHTRLKELDMKMIQNVPQNVRFFRTDVSEMYGKIEE